MASFDDLMGMVDATAQALLGGEEIVRDATLTVVTPGTRTPGALGAGTNPTRVTHLCSGIVKAFDTSLIDGSLVRRDDRRIKLLTNTLPDGVAPKPNDEIAIDGTTYIVIAVLERDPAKFQFTCHGRK